MVSVEIAAPDEGFPFYHTVEGSEVAHARSLWETHRARVGRIAVDDAHLFTVALHTHSEQPEGPVFLLGNKIFDDLLILDVYASVLDEGKVVVAIVGPGSYPS